MKLEIVPAGNTRQITSADGGTVFWAGEGAKIILPPVSALAIGFYVGIASGHSNQYPNVFTDENDYGDAFIEIHSADGDILPQGEMNLGTSEASDQVTGGRMVDLPTGAGVVIMPWDSGSGIYWGVAQKSHLIDPKEIPRTSTPSVVVNDSTNNGRDVQLVAYIDQVWLDPVDDAELIADLEAATYTNGRAVVAGGIAGMKYDDDSYVYEFKTDTSVIRYAK